MAPSVSVVTPFYNTREFLAQCIESVLHQTYQDWEYVLVDNRSTDGSSEIAQEYAARHPEKIRLMHTSSFLTQVQNYNFALSCISPVSKYCKMVQADDWLFPHCIQNMVDLAEAHPAVGIVSAYELEGEHVVLDGLPYPSPEVSGRDVCRRYFLDQTYLFGTPTSLLMRSELIRSRVPFYEERFAPFEDAHACFDLLRTWKFGFVHQVLTYSRRDNASILSRILPFKILYLSRLTLLIAHGRDYLSPGEYQRCLKAAEQSYFLYLAKCACKLHRLSKDFWKFHRNGLASIGYALDSRLLAKWIPRALLENSWDSFWSRWDRRSFLVSNEDVESSGRTSVHANRESAGGKGAPLIPN